jgi:hypothetical protein
VAYLSGEYASMPFWRNPTRYRHVKLWPGSPLGCGFYSSAVRCSRSYFSLMGTYRTAAGSGWRGSLYS